MKFFTVITFHVCLIFLALRGSRVSGVKIIISHDTETWFNARRICQEKYNGKLLNNIDGSRQKHDCLSQLPSNTEVWSGEILSPYLSHEGCFGNLMMQSNRLIHVQSVGECYIFCQGITDYFGVQKREKKKSKVTRCYCITDSERRMLLRTSHDQCDNTCSNSNSDNFEYCGGKMALNVYRKIQMKGQQGDGMCLVVNCSYPDYHLSAQKCDSEYKYVCASKGYLNDKKVTFAEASSLCNSRYNDYLSSYLTTLCDTRKSQAGSMYWVDVRRYSVSSSEKHIYTTETQLNCGYFLSGFTGQMEFDNDCINTATKRRYACETDDMNIKVCSFKDSENMQDGVIKCFYAAENKSTKSIPVVDISVPVTCICGIILIVLVIICRRKRDSQGYESIPTQA